MKYVARLCQTPACGRNGKATTPRVSPVDKANPKEALTHPLPVSPTTVEFARNAVETAIRDFEDVPLDNL